MGIDKSEIVKKIREFVKEECDKPSSKYGSEPYEAHFVPMANYAKKLAIKKDVDIELIEIAGWLHDIGSIIYGRQDHHITGCEIAEIKLKEFGYPLEKIELVKKCILNHRGSVDNKRETIEEQIIVEADALSNFKNISGIFKAAFVYEGLSQLEAIDSVREKLKRKFNQLSPEGQNLVRDKMEAVKILLGDCKK